VRERDFFLEPFSPEELREVLSGTRPAQAFAWRSPRARAMGLDPADPPADEELLRLMLEVPYLLRRPVVRMGSRVVFGADRAAIKALIEQAEGKG
jgi:arsenate reductase-like glutaredoxin family protein